jgi:hypothetical protein
MNPTQGSTNTGASATNEAACNAVGRMIGSDHA